MLGTELIEIKKTPFLSLMSSFTCKSVDAVTRGLKNSHLSLRLSGEMERALSWQYLVSLHPRLVSLASHSISVASPIEWG